MKKVTKNLRFDIETIDQLNELGLNNIDGYRKLINQGLFIIRKMKENNIDLNFINHIFKLGVNKYLEDEKYYGKNS